MDANMVGAAIYYDGNWRSLAADRGFAGLVHPSSRSGKLVE